MLVQTTQRESMSESHKKKLEHSELWIYVIRSRRQNVWSANRRRQIIPQLVVKLQPSFCIYLTSARSLQFNYFPNVLVQSVPQHITRAPLS